ncbi:MAG TPA: sulfatase [Verrucomicrobiae bacterium]|nr:sulfatase [Verrucomicrobiae bacterium]
MNCLNKLTSGAALLLMTLSVSPPVRAAEPSSKPNVLLIIADDLNNWIGAEGGHPQTLTPNLDKLAARGVTFRNAMCAAPFCNPSRTAFLSGMRPSTTGVYDNDEVWMPLIGRGLCLNDYIRKFGYTSLACGKVYHYRDFRAEDWDQVAYYVDDTLPGRPARRSPGPFGYRMFVAGKPEKPFEVQRPESKLVDYRSVSWAIDRLHDQKGPFFLACGLHRPHTPWDVPKKYFDMHPLDSIQLPAVLTNDLDDVPAAGQALAHRNVAHAEIVRLGLWKDRVRAYLAAISYADAQIGRLLDALNASPFRENTIILFVGDNGWHLGQKEHWAKVTLWNEATRVPMIWVVPGLTPAGADCTRAVDFMSIYPTICELTGIPRPSHVEGVSIKRLLQNPAAPWDIPAVSTMFKDNHSVRTEEWRYTRYADGSEELYNEKNDPYEWTNLVSKAEFKDVKDHLATFLPKINVDTANSPRLGRKQKRRRAGAE